MGMGSFAVGSFVIEYKDLKKICPDEIKAIEKAKYFGNIGWGVIGRWLSWSDNDQMMESLYDAVLDDESKPTRLGLSEEQIVEDIFDQYERLVANLKTTFNKKTKLSLYFDSYDEEGGDRYDNPGDKDGCIFCVDGMVQLTPAGKKFKDIITERKWTQYG
ncbi:hypothetical protein EB001_13430 [bacterium]|nr:hypothetical protein [bacterium]